MFKLTDEDREEINRFPGIVFSDFLVSNVARFYLSLHRERTSGTQENAWHFATTLREKLFVLLGDPILPNRHFTTLEEFLNALGGQYAWRKRWGFPVPSDEEMQGITIEALVFWDEYVQANWMAKFEQYVAHQFDQNPELTADSIAPDEPGDLMPMLPSQSLH